MRGRRIGATMLAGLLYGQGLLGLIAVGAMLERNPHLRGASGTGYGIEMNLAEVALDAAADGTFAASEH